MFAARSSRVWHAHKFHRFWNSRLDVVDALCTGVQLRLREATAALASVLTQVEPLLTGRVASVSADFAESSIC